MTNKIYSHFDERRLVKMKFNFTKIVPILTGAILLGSTIGFASSVSAATSLSSTDFSADNAVVVIGNAAALDNVAALDISSKMGSTTTALTGETFKIESSSKKLTLGSNLTTVKTTVLNNGDLPVLLKKSTYQARSGSSYDYEQEIQLQSGLGYMNFRDDDLKNEPVLGMKIAKSAPLLNYTLNLPRTLKAQFPQQEDYQI
jgi:hypothetical protein